MKRNHKAGSPAAYNDVKYVLDLALERPGLRYRLKTSGAAVNFKSRCNSYMKLCREQAAEVLQLVPGARAETAYDTIILRQQDDEGKPSAKGCNLIFDRHELKGDLIDPETGEIIEIPGVTNFLQEQ